MATFTTDQIEAKALEVFEMRQANYRRHIGVSFVPGKFAGEERAFCLASAVERLEREDEARQQAQAVIDSMSRMSDAGIRRELASIEDRRYQPHYFLITNTKDVNRDFAAMAKYHAELARREALAAANTIKTHEVA